jgi:hypothetical protein
MGVGWQPFLFPRKLAVVGGSFVLRLESNLSAVRYTLNPLAKAFLISVRPAKSERGLAIRRVTYLLK